MKAHVALDHADASAGLYDGAGWREADVNVARSLRLPKGDLGGGSGCQLK